MHSYSKRIASALLALLGISITLNPYFRAIPVVCNSREEIKVEETVTRKRKKDSVKNLKKESY
jgi:hypothetical protein